MRENIKDYLHFYLGCECKFGVFVPGQETVFYGQYVDTRVIHNVLNDLAEVKLVLRPLSDMTYEEFIEGAKIHVNNGGRVRITIQELKSQSIQPMRPEVFRWALSKHFDLFGLIDAGLAIDKTTLK